MKLTREQRIRQKLYWFQEARELGNVKLACRRMEISRKTYYKWWRIYVESGYNTQSLADRSRRAERRESNNHTL
ncbi:MAG: helix-turn-helix domain-containing protein [Deltaproteobacteria bacterium]|nr:helix-turn-helix domain-containing protein [Deltaproteobacteria bacterium]